ncbi:MAG: hypothetical protein U0136_10720 [Bdellovibrionota bacterium]
MKWIKALSLRGTGSLEAQQEEIVAHADQIAALIHSIRSQTSAVEEELRRYVNALDADGARNLVILRRITEALSVRLDKLTKLLEVRTEEALERARQLAASDLVIPNDPVHALITEPRLAPIPIASLSDALERISKKVVLRGGQHGTR